MGAELRIGEVAGRTGTTPRTIRYYEEIGLLPGAAGRRPGSHRAYREEDVERLADLLRLKDLLGLSLEELKDLVSAEDARAARKREWNAGVGDPARRREILAEADAYVEKLLDRVRERRTEIAALEAELQVRRRRIRGLARSAP